MPLEIMRLLMAIMWNVDVVDDVVSVDVNIDGGAAVDVVFGAFVVDFDVPVFDVTAVDVDVVV